ncbi:sensor histidine kinase [Priestia abyssalis]|uniref:sensor histidine kinase n=1 Tax=Priestia abyssalis TaxID=1221450 RepID=UPI0009953B8C|nr:HAMP domain-containing sensor histidine kinase [Priestia abyssalis]
MKNKPLALQIWLVISGILLVISLLLVVLFPTTLRNFFTDDIYTKIENEQLTLMEYALSGRAEERFFGLNESSSFDSRTVDHLLLPVYSSYSLISGSLPAEFLRETQILAANQKKVVERYSEDLGESTFFYVIRKASVNGQPAFLLSYTSDSYRNDLVYTLFKQLLLIMTIVFLFSWIPSIWLAKYLTRPLVTLEQHVRKIAQQDWHESVSVNRNDEIGKLGLTIEQMREKLVRKDEAQQALLQNISHDLKTPVMVIRSYAQSINDGIYPKGDLLGTVKVIEAEAERLEKKIKNLLYMTKLDYLSTRKPVRNKIDLMTLVCKAADRFRGTRLELEWDIHTMFSPAIIEGDEDQWDIVIDNLLENQLRYAASRIGIFIDRTTFQQRPFILLKVWNDGPHIERAVLDRLFEPFSKGSKGEFGIGLSIVKRIVSFHEADIWVTNEKDGPAFYIRIPADEKA